MSIRGPYRQHSPEFKLQLCTEIREGKLGRREALKIYQISANLIQLWLARHDHGKLNVEDVAAHNMADFETKIATLERKVGQLMMELDLKKTAQHEGMQSRHQATQKVRQVRIQRARSCRISISVSKRDSSIANLRLGSRQSLHSHCQQFCLYGCHPCRLQSERSWLCHLKTYRQEYNAGSIQDRLHSAPTETQFMHHHTDRGSQYTSAQYLAALQEYELIGDSQSVLECANREHNFELKV